MRAKLDIPGGPPAPMSSVFSSAIKTSPVRSTLMLLEYAPMV
ncbi:hypothetical protein FRAHR75_1100002 [Frankia sp. Hr75.2]|nr:hypothetical protein FRAHR75_1100002 [Frankia sp. Hr75.2]